MFQLNFISFYKKYLEKLADLLGVTNRTENSLEINPNSFRNFVYNKGGLTCPGRVTQLVGASSHTPKGYGFDSQSGHILRLGSVHRRQPIDVSLPHQCFPFLLPLNLKSVYISLGED